MFPLPAPHSLFSPAPTSPIQSCRPSSCARRSRGAARRASSSTSRVSSPTTRRVWGGGGGGARRGAARRGGDARGRAAFHVPPHTPPPPDSCPAATSYFCNRSADNAGVIVNPKGEMKGALFPPSPLPTREIPCARRFLAIVDQCRGWRNGLDDDTFCPNSLIQRDESFNYLSGLRAPLPRALG